MVNYTDPNSEIDLNKLNLDLGNETPSQLLQIAIAEQLNVEHIELISDLISCGACGFNIIKMMLSEIQVNDFFDNFGVSLQLIQELKRIVKCDNFYLLSYLCDQHNVDQ